MVTPGIITVSLVLISGIIIGMDIVLYSNDTKNDTVSNIMRDSTNNGHFYWIFLFGVLAGHFFLGQTQNLGFLESLPENATGFQYVLIFGGMTLLSLISYGTGKFLIKKIKDNKIILLCKGAVLVVGILFGHYVWSQERNINQDQSGTECHICLTKNQD